MANERISAALRFFFDTYLSAAQRTILRDQAATVAVRLGAYRRNSAHTAYPVIGGGNRTPDFLVAVARQAMTLRDGVPDPTGAALGSGPNLVPLLWLRDIADAGVDSAEEIERVMQNINYFVGEGHTRDAAAWAQAIAGHPDRRSLTRNLSEYEAVPAPLQALVDNVSELRETLFHFFTFTEAGEYYARWTGAGRTIPADLSDTYRQRNIIELQLARDEVYLYAVVPQGFLDPGAAAESAPAGQRVFREVVWGFDWGEDGITPTEVEVVHTVTRTAAAGDYFDFVAFEAEEGIGVAMPVTARATIDEGLANFLFELPDDPAARTAELTRSRMAVPAAEGGPFVKMIATVEGDAPLPDGVVATGAGQVKQLLVPPEQVVDLAALERVLSLREPRLLYPRLADVRPIVNLAALEARIPAAHRSGAGAVIGVIDSGLDAQHPAFAGRVLGVWDQGDPTGPAPSVAMNAAATTPMEHAFDLLRTLLYGVGTEFTGATAGNARDPGDHGTHVTGIAAGAAVGGANPVPVGMAPAAQIVVVGGGRPAPDPNDVFSPANTAMSDFDTLTGVAYIREKARQFNAAAPVVINMSWGHHDHAHDGTDALSRALTDAAKDRGSYIPGLAFVAAAGNERTDHRHLQRTVAAHSVETLQFAFTGLDAVGSSITDVITIWVTNPTPGGTHLRLRVRTRRPPPSVVTTRRYRLRANHTPVWETKWGAGVHIGTSFGPPDPINGDFNIRIRFQTALALIPDAAGTHVVNGANHRLVRLRRNWTIKGTNTDIFTVANAIIVPLGRSAPPAGAGPGLLASFATLNGLTAHGWEVLLRNPSDAAREVHVWAGRENAAFANETPADLSHLICAPADGDGVIAVASSNSRLNVPNPPGADIIADPNPEGALTSWSGPGPLRKQPAQPGIDITAPGCVIVSARSATNVAAGNDIWSVNTNAMRMSGTSMASPVVAGILANVLADEPALTMDHLRTRFETCDIPTVLRDGVTPMPAGLPITANDWGQGLIDANKLK